MWGNLLKMQGIGNVKVVEIDNRIPPCLRLFYNFMKSPFLQMRKRKFSNLPIA